MFKLPGSIGVVYIVTVPDSTNFALRNLNVKSWFWLGVQIVPFCDLNKLPPIYCLDTTTFCTSGRDVVLTDFSPIVDTHMVYLSEDGHKNMSAYSSSGGKYTGDGNLIVVGTEASFDMLISSGLKTISVKSCTKVRVGIPNSIDFSNE